jgi:hypothetical protein
MFVLVLLILNDSEPDCQLIGTFSDHQAAVCKTMASSTVCVLFIQKKKAVAASKFPTPLENARMCCTHSLHMADMQWFFFLLAALYISKYACFSS